MIRFSVKLVAACCLIACSIQTVCSGQMTNSITSESIVDIMDTRNMKLRDYRRMFMNSPTPSTAEMVGTWRGVNKGIVQLVGYGQFIKEIVPAGDLVIGDNIQVHQVSEEMLRINGWQPKIDHQGQIERKGKFAVKSPSGRGKFGHGAVISYRAGGNRATDPAKLLVDKVVKLDDDHLLGRATANFGPLKIPLAYFVLERVQ